MELQMRINSEAKVIEETESKTFGCGSATGGSSLPAELVNGQELEKALAIKNTNIVREISLPRATLLDATGYSGIGRRLHLVGSPIL